MRGKYIEEQEAIEFGIPSTLDTAYDYIQNYKSEYQEEVPTIAGLAIRLRVSRNTITIWANQEGKEDFGEIFELLMATQERDLITSGLNNTFNAQVTKMLLGQHGHSDKVDSKVHSKNVNAEISLEDIDEYDLNLEIEALQEEIENDEGAKEDDKNA